MTRHMTLRDRVIRLSPVLLAVSVLIVYLPSLPGGYLNWDDPWLIENNPLLQRPTFASLSAVWADFSMKTRLSLGAEYLPVRDTSLWLESRLFGLHPQALRITNLAIYITATLLIRVMLIATIAHRPAAELAAWFFALHPVHVESVAWIAGRKDVLALIFVAAALAVHARGRPSPRWVVPALLLVSHLSKSMTVIAVGLLAAQDLLMRRRPDVRLYGACLAVAIAALVVHLEVGESVKMVGDPVGGSRLSAVMTMGPVWLRYLGLLAWPGSLSLVQDVVVRNSWDVAAILGYAMLLLWVILGAVLWRRRSEPFVLAAWLWFFVPLLPVSQIIFPLQNRMADRYLLLSVLAPGVLFVLATRRWPRAAAAVLTTGIATLAVASSFRAALFADSAAAFADATLKTKLSGVAPYQLGQALEDQGDEEGAMLAYLEVLQRMIGPSEPARRATNNLAKLLARRGNLRGAEKALRRGRTLWPKDPQVLLNLAEVLAREGRHGEARRRFEQLLSEHPNYKVGRQAYQRHYGTPRSPRQVPLGTVETPH